MRFFGSTIRIRKPIAPQFHAIRGLDRSRNIVCFLDQLLTYCCLTTIIRALEKAITQGTNNSSKDPI